MPLPYLDRYLLSQDSNFQKRVGIASCRVATQIAAEAQGTQKLAVFTKRLALAKVMIHAPYVHLLHFAIYAASNGIEADVSDSQLEAFLNANWNLLADIDSLDYLKP